MKRQVQQRPSKQIQRQPQGSVENAYAADGIPLGLLDLPSPPQLNPRRWFGLFAFVLMSMAMLATALVVTTSKDKRTTLLKAEETRLQQSVEARIKILQTWLGSQHVAGKRLTESHVFQLFVADLEGQQPTLPLPRSLQDQRPYFLQLMADFARQNDLIRATIMKDDGTILLSSPGPSLPVPDLLRHLENMEKGWEFRPSFIRHVDDQDGQIVIDFMMVFPRPQMESKDEGRPSTLLVLTAPIDHVIESVLSNQSVTAGRDEISLLQWRGDAVDRITMTADGIEFSAEISHDGLHAGRPLAFGLQGDVAPVYALAEPVEGTAWTLAHIIDARLALSPVYDFIKVASGLSAMAVVVLTAAFAALWWRQGSNHHRLVASLYREQAERIDRQRQFLQSITKSIRDWLTVDSPDGQLIYANPAFEAAAGSLEGPVIGKTWDDFVRESHDEELLQDDLIQLTGAGSFDFVEIGGSRRIISSHVSNLTSEDGSVHGMVRVVRDHTALIAEQQRRQLSVTQTVDAFIHAIELRDPFLLGHTERLRTHAIAIGRKLGLSTSELASLALAASLSQIGKIFIPDHILAKPDRHSAEEMAVMRNHSLHAVDILTRIDFDLPVANIVAQMHERLDGSGYPHGLAGDQIEIGPRILGVVDVFCARTAPRSYRDRISAGRTLYHLASNDRRYDLKVVAALADIVGHDDVIDDNLGKIERTFIDTAAWRKRRLSDELIPEPS